MSSLLQVYAIQLYGYAMYLCLFIDQWTPELLSSLAIVSNTSISMSHQQSGYHAVW